MDSNVRISQSQIQSINPLLQKPHTQVSTQDKRIQSTALKTLEEKEKAVTEQIHSLRHDIQGLHEKQSSLTSKVTNITKQTSEIKVQRERAQLAIILLEKQLDKIQIEINQISYKASKNQESQEPVKESIKSTQQKITTAQIKLEEHKALLQSEKSKSAEASAEFKSLQFQAKGLEDQLKQAKEQRNAQTVASNELEELITRADKELLDARTQLETTASTLTNIKEKHNSKTNELFENAQKIDATSKEIIFLETKASGKSLSAVLNKITNWLPGSKLREAKRTLETAQKNATKLENEVKNLRLEVNALESDLKAASLLASDKYKAGINLTSEKNQIDQQIKEVSSTIEALKTSKTEKVSEATSKNDEIRKILQTIDQYETEKATIKSSLQTLNKQLVESTGKLTKLEDKHSQFKQQIQELKLEKTEKTAQVSFSKDTIQQKEIELKENEKHLQETKKTLESIGNEIRSKSEDLTHLQKELNDTQIAIQKELKSIEDQIEQEKITQNAHQVFDTTINNSSNSRTSAESVKAAFRETIDKSQVQSTSNSSATTQNSVQATPSNLSFEEKYNLHLARMQEVINGKKLSVDDNRQVVTAERSKVPLGHLRSGKSENAQKSLEAELHELQSLIREVKDQGSKEQITHLQKTLAEFLKTDWVSKTLESSSKLQTAAQEVLNEAENVNIFDQTFKLRVLNKLISENSGSESGYIQWNEKTNTPDISKRLLQYTSDRSKTKIAQYIQHAIETEIERLEQLSTRTDIEWKQLSKRWKSEKEMSPQEIKIKYIEEEISSLSTLITNLEKITSKEVRKKITPDSKIIPQATNDRFNSLIDQAMAQRDKCIEELKGHFNDGNVQSYTLTKNDFDDIEKNITDKNNKLKPEEQLNAEKLADKIVSKKRELFFPLYEIARNEQTYANGLIELYKTLKDQYEQLQKTPGNDDLKQTFKKLFLDPLEPLVPLAQHSSTLMNEALPQKPTDFTGTSSEWNQKVIDEKLDAVDLSKFQKVAQSFKDITGPLGTYSSLYNDQLGFITEMKKLSSSNSKLKTWASDFVQAMGKKTIAGADGNKTSPTFWLIAPIQRATRYKMTLVEAAKSADNAPNLKTAIDSWCTPAGVLAEIANHVTGKQDLSKCKYNASTA